MAAPNRSGPSRHWDLPLLAVVCGLVAFGLLMVYSSSFIFAQEKLGSGYALIGRQSVFAILGGAALVVGWRLDPRIWSRAAYPLIGLTLVLLAACWIPGLGARVGGAQRWIRFGGLQFQPGELAKFALLVFASFQIARKHDRIGRFGPALVSVILPPLPVFLLLLLQPDFGTTAISAATLLLLVFVAGVPMRWIAASGALALSAGALLVAFSPYRRARLLGFLDPWGDPGGKGFQVLQGFVGLHSGGLFGVGLGNGKEKLLFLPEAHNDFILAVVGEELGFVGLAGLLAAFLALTLLGLRVATRVWRARGDLFLTLLAAGISGLFALQAFVNVGVVLGLLPTKGLTLPFVSYGGSALILNLFEAGILLAIARVAEVEADEVAE